jgi:hypothetical protein
VGGRPAPDGSRRGGGSIQATHPLRLGLALTAAAAGTPVALAALVTTGTLRQDELLAAVAALAALAFTAAGMSLLLPWTLALLGACTILAAEHGDVGDVGIVVAAALLLLAGECLAAAADLKGVALVDRPLVSRLVGRLAAEAIAAGLVAALVVVAGSLDVRADLATFTIGLLAALALLGVVTVLARRVAAAGD